MLVGALARHQPAACDELLLRPMLGPLLAATPSPGFAPADAREREEACARALRAIGRVLTTSPPPPAKLCQVALCHSTAT